VIREMLHPAQRRKLGPKAVPGRSGLGKERRDSTIAGGSWREGECRWTG
jgi:hypothetical protein